jgi:hypothetical protein
MKQEKNVLESNQLIKDLDENEKVISKIENENTEANQFMKKTKKKSKRKNSFQKQYYPQKK